MLALVCWNAPFLEVSINSFIIFCYDANVIKWHHDFNQPCEALWFVLLSHSDSNMVMIFQFIKTSSFLFHRSKTCSLKVKFPPTWKLKSSFHFSKPSNPLFNLSWVSSRISLKYFWNFIKLLKASKVHRHDSKVLCLLSKWEWRPQKIWSSAVMMWKEK